LAHQKSDLQSKRFSAKKQAPKNNRSSNTQTSSPIQAGEKTDFFSALSPSVKESRFKPGKKNEKKTVSGRIPLALPNTSLSSIRPGSSLFDLQQLLPPGYKIKSAEITSLNSDKNKFYIFDKRLANGAIPIWYRDAFKAVVAFLQENPNNTTSRSWSTNVEVIIDKTGEIIEVQPYRLSGTWRFDKAPINAFKTFAKAPNPPKEMLDENGFAHLRYNFTVNLIYTPVELSNANSPSRRQNRF